MKDENAASSDVGALLMRSAPPESEFDRSDTTRMAYGLRMCRALLMVAYCACSFPQPKLDEGQGGPDGGVGSPDGSALVDAPPCTAGFLDTCAATATEDLLVTANVGISTDTDPRCRTVMQAGGPNVCLMVFRDVQISTTATLFAHGSRPLAIAARRMMTIDGAIDVSSRADSSLSGAGSGNPNFCSTGNPAIDSMGGASGAGGGSFLTRGGEGGRGNTDGVGGGPSSVPGGTSGPAYSAPAFLRGGCHGQQGGAGSSIGGMAGLGGGGVYLHAPTLLISGEVFAGGGGGRTGEGNDGGGGGGSGGMIVLESNALSVSGFLVATGAGGGGGGLGSMSGQNGLDGRTLFPAGGGAGSTSGGTGGRGGINVDGLAGENHGGGGGGGGGGAGLIILIGVTSIEGLAAPPFVTR